MYGKIVNGNLILAPNMLTIDGFVHYHPSNTLYEQEGYLPIEDTLYPEISEENPKEYSCSYKEQDNKIIKVWVEVTEQVDYDEKVYSIDDRVEALESSVAEINEKINGKNL